MGKSRKQDAGVGVEAEIDRSLAAAAKGFTTLEDISVATSVAYKKLEAPHSERLCILAGRRNGERE